MHLSTSTFASPQGIYFGSQCQSPSKELLVRNAPLLIRSELSHQFLQRVLQIQLSTHGQQILAAKQFDISIHFNTFQYTCKKTSNIAYVSRNVHVRSCNHYCSEMQTSNSYPECVCAAAGIQHSMRMCHIGTCGLPRSTIFFHIIS